tara:strand:- start:774 stop:878 length:105 start_codon:yes stop_codon:yes gene_type:complete
MNRSQQQLYNDVHRIASAIEKLVKILDKELKENE